MVLAQVAKQPVVLILGIAVDRAPYHESYTPGAAKACAVHNRVSSST